MMFLKAFQTLKRCWIYHCLSSPGGLWRPCHTAVQPSAGLWPGCIRMCGYQSQRSATHLGPDPWYWWKHYLLGKPDSTQVWFFFKFILLFFYFTACPTCWTQSEMQHIYLQHCVMDIFNTEAIFHWYIWGNLWKPPKVNCFSVPAKTKCGLRNNMDTVSFYFFLSLPH